MASLLCVILALATGVNAAEIRVVDDEGERPRIVIAGEIELGDAARFRSVTVDLPPAVIYLDGPGGKLIDALAIGDRLRERGDFTAVAANAHCTSACALIWIAGVERSWQDGGSIGFHAAAAREGDVVRMTASGNAIVGAYLTRLGYPVSVVVMATEADHTSMSYLTADLAERSGLTYTRVPKGLRDGQLATASVPSASQSVTMGSLRHRMTERQDEAREEAVVRARQFLDFYFSSANASPGALRTLAGRVYADQVDSFGLRISRADLIRRRADQAERWPSYSLTKNGAPSITCTSGGLACTVIGEADFAAANPGTGARSAGTLMYTLRLHRIGATFRVVHEDTQVVPDRVTGLTRQIQAALVRVGCAPGPVDGLWGTRTARALADYARAGALELDTTRPTYDALALISVAGGASCRPGTEEASAGTAGPQL
ncbi:hypothetical protein DLJ53_17220 [Acuticoccus sediminis]|uniref:Peptidoglycan binding-like domain-containing protein n=1 Tax=Acuticoccus sediminis TaxID=2184697 RepID=A0A8B2NYT4_9HYPH|nr:hypothetical protein [Acuticoccus sediminis]RAI00968.1 hypothetical protein DLJ53_17220 [Acuticoccus sediminis]